MRSPRRKRRGWTIGPLAVFAIGFGLGDAGARDHYVDPAVPPAPNLDSSPARPWSSLQNLIDGDLIAGGDRIVLRSGYYGELIIRNKRHKGMVWIVAAAGHTPRFRRVHVRASANWHLQGFHVSPSFAGTYEKRKMVRIERDAADITIEDFTLQSTADATSWTAADWNAKAADGIFALGPRIRLLNNRMKNVNFGITVVGSRARVEGNLVENFAGDGMRGLGDHALFAGNTVNNCYDINQNHDDGFQSWSRGADGRPGTGRVTGVILRGNRFINYEDFRCVLQGIGMFDGTYVDWVIENNVVITDHRHGITVMGAENVRVVNNTVLGLPTDRIGPHWITITRHVDGTLPKRSIIANNLAASFNPRGSRKFFPTARSGVSLHSNILVRRAEDFVRAVAKFDVRLKPGSRAIDAGDVRFAPKTDIEGKLRINGADVGAYETQ